MKRSTYMNKSSCAICLGLLLLVLGVALILSKSRALEFISSTFVLKPNSMIETNWRRTPEEIPTDVYLFNWTNPEHIHNISVKPKFEQLGPYRFMQDMRKVNVVWNDNDTVTFNQVRTWSFDQGHTNGRLDDSVTTINSIGMSSAHFVRYWGYFMKRSVSTIISTLIPEIHITKTVNQFLFEGYQDLINDAIQFLPFLAPEAPRLDKFGWFRMRNGSTTFDGTFNMANGVHGDFDLLNWNYYNVTPYFGTSCAKVHGSVGELYSRNLTRDHVGVFFSDICRYLLLDYEEDVEFDGILGYKFKVGDSILDNGTLIPGNKCYCAGDCMPSGMLNVSSCRYGFPAFASLPNFYGGDPVYVDVMEGVKPEKSKHETFIVLEPTTGAMLKASLRIQFNLLMHPVEHIDVYENVRHMYFPVFWVEQIIQMPAHLRPLLKIFLNAPLIINIVSSIFIITGLGLVLHVVYKPIAILIYKKVHGPKELKQLGLEETPLRAEEATMCAGDGLKENYR